jgi:hypothetical protein
MDDAQNLVLVFRLNNRGGLMSLELPATGQNDAAWPTIVVICEFVGPRRKYEFTAYYLAEIADQSFWRGFK